MGTYEWTDRLMEGSAEDVTEEQKSQALTFLSRANRIQSH